MIENLSPPQLVALSMLYVLGGLGLIWLSRGFKPSPWLIRFYARFRKAWVEGMTDSLGIPHPPTPDDAYEDEYISYDPAVLDKTQSHTYITGKITKTEYICDLTQENIDRFRQLEMDNVWLAEGLCPDCHEGRLISGPSGGMCQNVTCEHCGARFNVSALGTCDRLSPGHVTYDSPGWDEGDTCHREGCLGTLAISEPENCYCHISAPCSSCTSVYLYCPVCGWQDEPGRWDG